MKRTSVSAAILLALCLTLTGCLAAGYSSTNGWHIWPGPFSLLLTILVVVFLLLRRRR